MQRNTQYFPTRFTAIFACLLGVLALDGLRAQPAPAAPAAPVSPAALNRLFTEAEESFTAKDYPTAVTKITELLTARGSNKDALLGLLYFNIWCGNKLAKMQNVFLRQSFFSQKRTFNYNLHPFFVHQTLRSLNLSILRSRSCSFFPI